MHSLDAVAMKETGASGGVMVAGALQTTTGGGQSLQMLTGSPMMSGRE